MAGRRLDQVAWARLVASAAIVVCSSAAAAEDHRVEPGEHWSRLAQAVKPGDQIVLLPGTHRPASFLALRGTEREPITIRGVDAEHPAEIAAEGSGLLLQSPRHLVLQDIVVTGARQNGINIDDQDGSGTIGDPWEADLTLRRVTVRATGPAGNTDGIKLSGLRRVRLESCVVEGWGGSAIDLVGCHDVVIEGCILRGVKGYEQSSGIQTKGGSSGVTIIGCRFEDAGSRAVNLGGSTGLGYFRPPVPEDAAPGSRFEAERVRVERCVFLGGECAVAIVGARGAEVVACTIVGPRRWPFRLLQETTDPRFGRSEGALVAGCIIVADVLGTPINIGHGTDPGAFRFEQNIWWAPGITERALDALPGERRGAQHMLDPLLGDDLLPGNEAAAGFGAVR